MRATTRVTTLSNVNAKRSSVDKSKYICVPKVPAIILSLCVAAATASLRLSVHFCYTNFLTHLMKKQSFLRLSARLAAFVLSLGISPDVVIPHIIKFFRFKI